MEYSGYLFCVRLWLDNISASLKGMDFKGLKNLQNSGIFWPSEPIWHHNKGFPSCIKLYDFCE